MVYKGTLDQNRTIVAFKIFNLEHRGAFKSFRAECGVLRNIRHRNLVKVITACSGVDYKGNDFKALVYEYMVNGSLEDWLHLYPKGTSCVPRNLNLLQRLRVAVDVAFALEYLHQGCGASIVHCDLKPSNVLLDDEMVAHVGDFGLAKFLAEGITSSYAYQSSSVGVRGTIGYAPPGKRPTDGMFKAGLSLHSFVKASLTGQVTDIIDPAILKDIYGDQKTSNISTCNFRTGNSRILLEALISTLDIAVSCSAELPWERPDMRDVAARLSSNRNKLHATCL